MTQRRINQIGTIRQRHEQKSFTTEGTERGAQRPRRSKVASGEKEEKRRAVRRGRWVRSLYTGGCGTYIGGIERLSVFL